ncbi:hypothetical protein ACFWG6_29020 [Streptomyces erythrochromogenes]|uniref:hypothetical protein n=1 Tax=Streptomyces erythrochromogenes TaxID=285574 RepID=UPI00363F7DB7
MNNILNDSLAQLIGGLALAVVLAGWAWVRRTRRAAPRPQERPTLPRQVRRYTLLDTRGDDGQPQHLISTLPAGTVVTCTAGGGPERFELTDAVLPDGSFAAEPLHRFQ